MKLKKTPALLTEDASQFYRNLLIELNKNAAGAVWWDCHGTDGWWLPSFCRNKCTTSCKDPMGMLGRASACQPQLPFQALTLHLELAPTIFRNANNIVLTLSFGARHCQCCCCRSGTAAIADCAFSSWRTLHFSCCCAPVRFHVTRASPR